MSFAYLVSLLLLGSIAFALVREMRKASPRPAGLRGHIRARGWGKHAAGIFGKLDLAPSDDDNRRVLAVLAYLGS